MPKETFQPQMKERIESKPSLFFLYSRRGGKERGVGTSLLPKGEFHDYTLVKPALAIEMVQPDQLSQEAMVTWQLFKSSEIVLASGNPSLNLYLEFQSSHTLEFGLNLLYPEAAIATDRIPAGKYSFCFSIKYQPRPEPIVELGPDGAVTNYRNMEKLFLNSIEDVNKLIN